MTPDALLAELRTEFTRRKFVAGLFVAIVDLLDDLDALGGRFGSTDELFLAYPRQTETAGGKGANTLIVAVDGRNRSLRPFYNRAETLFRVEHKRFDYPNAAPHATQAWRDYLPWFEALLGYPPETARTLRERVIEHVLEELPSFEVDTATLEPLARPFSALLDDFDTSAHKGEKQGAVFQGMVFATIRADAPHLFVEVAKVGAGSKRLNREGDIDAWQGERLALSAEVKSYRLDEEGAHALVPFVESVLRRRAMTIVAAHSFTDGARAFLTEQGVRLLDLDRLTTMVDLWDSLKQQAAFDAFVYYVHHVEKNHPLMERLSRFDPTSPTGLFT
jgi:hypothetical protein